MIPSTSKTNHVFSGTVSEVIFDTALKQTESEERTTRCLNNLSSQNLGALSSFYSMISTTKAICLHNRNKSLAQDKTKPHLCLSLLFYNMPRKEYIRLIFMFVKVTIVSQMSATSHLSNCTLLTALLIQHLELNIFNTDSFSPLLQQE